MSRKTGKTATEDDEAEAPPAAHVAPVAPVDHARVPLSDLVKVIPQFNADSEMRPQAWNTRVNAALDTYNVQPQHRTGTLMLHFVHPDVYEHLSVLGHSDGDLAKFQKGLNATYGQQASPGMVLLKLQSLKQAPGSPIQAFARDFAVLARSVEGLKIDDYAVQFLANLADPRVRDHLVASPPADKTFSAYVAAAAVFEANTQAMAAPTGSTTAGIQAVEASHVPVAAVFSQPYRGRGGGSFRGRGQFRPDRGFGRGRGGPMQCYRCRGYGHKASQCPSPDTQGVSRTSTHCGLTGSTQVASKAPAQPVSSRHTSFVLRPPSTHLNIRILGDGSGASSTLSAVRVPVMLNRTVKSSATVDSGAEANVVSADYLRTVCRLAPASIPAGSSVTLATVSGSQLTCTGVVNLHIRFAPSVSVQERFFVVAGLPSSQQLILGTPFLYGQRVDVSVSRRGLVFLKSRRFVKGVACDAPDVPYVSTVPLDPPAVPAPVVEQVKQPKASTTLAYVLQHIKFGDLAVKHKPVFVAILADFLDCFAESPETFGNANVEPLYFKVDDDSPIHKRPMPTDFKAGEFVANTTALWLEHGRIRPSHSSITAQCFPVPKPGSDDYRLVVNFKDLNQRIAPDNYPPPAPRAIFDSLGGTQVYNLFDFQNAYLQIPLHEDCKSYTSFVTAQGQFEFNFVPFGLNVAGGKLQRELESAFAGVSDAHGYADDWLIASGDLEKSLSQLRLFLLAVRKSGFLLKPSKCVVGASSVEFLGRIISAEGIRLLPADKSAIEQWPEPTTKRQLQSFLGTYQWCAEFVPGFTAASKPLRKPASPSHDFIWYEEQQRAFAALKRMVGSAMLLSFPDFKAPFTLECDASTTGFAALLKQGQRVIHLAQRMTTPAESGSAATILELSCLIWAVQYFSRYLRGRHFTVVTDHKALTWISSLKSPSKKLALWALALSEYSFDVTYRKGSDHTAADTLSRIRTVAPVTVQPVQGTGFPSVEELRKAQLDDESMASLFNRVKANPAAHPEFIIDQDDVLCQLSQRYSLPSLRPIVPLALRARVVAAAHEISSHMSAATIHLLKSNYHWHGISAQATKYMAGCAVCLQTRPSTNPLQLPRGTVDSHSCNSLIACDLLGGLQTDSEGYTYILVVQDYFSRFRAAAALKTKTSAEVAEALDNIWFRPYQPPATLLTDQGGEFNGPEFNSLLRNNGTSHRFTTAYHPESDGMVERSNRTILQGLRAVVPQNAQSTWRKYLQSVISTLNNTPSVSTGHAPTLVFFGREPRQLNNIQPPVPSMEQQSKAATDISQLHDQLAAHNTSKAEASKRDNSAPTVRTFTVGDWVMVSLPRLRTAAYSKLTRGYVGPCLVVLRKSATTYYVRQYTPSRDGSLYSGTVHIKAMKLCASIPKGLPIGQRASTGPQLVGSGLPGPQPIGSDTTEGHSAATSLSEAQHTASRLTGAQLKGTQQMGPQPIGAHHTGTLVPSGSQNGSLTTRTPAFHTPAGTQFGGTLKVHLQKIPQPATQNLPRKTRTSVSEPPPPARISARLAARRAEPPTSLSHPRRWA